MRILINELIRQGLITEDNLKDAKEKQLGAKKPIQDLLIEMGFLKEADLIRVSSELFKVPVLSLVDVKVDPKVIKLISYEAAKKYGVFPVLIDEENALVLAMSDPVDIAAIDEIKQLVNMEIKPSLSAKSDISVAVEKHYCCDDMLYDLMKRVESQNHEQILTDKKEYLGHFDMEMLKEDNGPVERLINFILSDAVKTRASDIHVEPKEDAVRVRFRVDGELKNILDIPKGFLSFVTARIKVMAGLDLAENRKSQDGRSRITVFNRNVDLRVSVVPSYYGEKVVLRLLDPYEAKIELDKLGFAEDELKLFKDAIVQPQGMVLVTGPTGSGKTSTLYAALNFIKSENKNIVTIEDPIEYITEGITQIQVNPVKDVTFAGGLRSVLRQDPNVILVGEIRDRETADIAFRSALTGHLVLSTLHTNSAVATVMRLLDIGLEPHLISSSLVLVVAQRLVKTICPECKVEYEPDPVVKEKFKFYLNAAGITKFYKGKGCEKCGFTGFRGRAAVLEMMRMNEKIRELVRDKASEKAITDEAKKSGLKFLVESGIARVACGATTLEELAENVEIIERVPPCAQPAVPLPPAAVVPAAVKTDVRAKPLILVVDDDDDMRLLVSSRLMTDGFDILEGANGQEAIGLAVRNKPDLIVMDVMMPIMNGYDAVKALRSRLDTASIPIIMLTAKSDVESELQGLDAGADDYMGKPFDGKKLIARVQMLLRRAKRSG